MPGNSRLVIPEAVLRQARTGYYPATLNPCLTMQITRTARAEQFEIKLKGRMDASWSDHVARALAECVQSGQHVMLWTWPKWTT